MTGSKRNPTAWLATLALLAAVISWGALVLRPAEPDESSLRDINGIEIITADSLPTDLGVQVDCHITNHTEQNASSVVFTVALVNSEGVPVASNPLGNVIDLAPGESRTATVTVPFTGSPLDRTLATTASVDLVRWENPAKGNPFPN